MVTRCNQSLVPTVNLLFDQVVQNGIVVDGFLEDLRTAFFEGHDHYAHVVSAPLSMSRSRSMSDLDVVCYFAELPSPFRRTSFEDSFYKERRK